LPVARLRAMLIQKEAELAERVAADQARLALSWSRSRCAWAAALSACSKATCAAGVVCAARQSPGSGRQYLARYGRPGPWACPPYAQ
jgi:hypothetical protein